MRRTTTLTIALALLLAGCGTSTAERRAARATTTTEPTTTTEATTTTTEPPTPVTVPPLRPGLLSMAKADADELGLKVRATDLRPLTTGERGRGIYDAANWVVLAQCPAAGTEAMPGDTVQVGVLKVGEASDTTGRLSADGHLDDEVC